MLRQAFIDEPDAVKLATAEAIWDAWSRSPRGALAALAMLSWVDCPEDQPMAFVVVEEILDLLIARSSDTRI